MNTARHLQARRIGAQPTNSCFPHSLRRRAEYQFAVDVAHEPRRRFELGLELPGTPPRVSNDKASARRRIGLQETPKQIRRRREVQIVGNPRPYTGFLLLGLPANKDPTA